MRRRWKFTLLGAGVLVVLASTLPVFFDLRYDPARLEGDATITDHGFWSYPRYEIRFPSLSLKSLGTHTYVCKGLPPETLRLMLQMPDKQTKEQEAAEFLRRHPNSKYAAEAYDKQKYETIGSNRTVVRFSLDVDGKSDLWMAERLCDWKLMWIPAYNSGAFWHPDAEFASSPKASYKLIFVISQVDPSGIPEEVVPVLQGGGNELP
jgi:hypothetical protein